MAKIIILNAPPGAGKDTIGEKLEKFARTHIVQMSFKAPMFEIALAMLGGRNYEKFLYAYNDRGRKEKPQSFLSGKSPRDFMIWISEEVIKPQFGNQYFGKRFSEDARMHGKLYPIICTDGGFADEIIALIEDGHTVKLCRLHRDGFTFAGDSRNYIRINTYYKKNGYSEHDYLLSDGKPMITVSEIIRDHLNSTNC